MRPATVCLIIGLSLVTSLTASAQTWQPGPDFWEAPQPRLHGAGVYYNGNVYVLGGSPFDTTDTDHGGATDYLWYDGSQFVPGPFLDAPFVSQGAAIDALGRAVIFGGWTGPGGDRGGTYVFDVANGRGASLPSRSAAAPAANFAWTTDEQHRIYSIGGGPGEAATGGSPNSTRVERFDAIANAWSVLAALPAGISNACAASDGMGHVLVFGGVTANASARIATTRRYDVATNTWSTGAVPDLPAAVSNARAVLGTDLRVYVIGGLTGPIHAGSPTTAVWVLDLRTNTWAAGPDLGTPRSDPAVAYDPDYASIFAMGGDDGAGGSYTSETLAIQTCPTFATQALPETLCVGRTAAFEADAQGDDPMSYQWQKDGADLNDGATASGSVISGAQTNVLTITGIGTGDAGSYAVVATNACGAATSVPAALRVTPPPALPGVADWVVTPAEFSTHTTVLHTISGGVIGGAADAVRTSTPAKGQYFFHAFLWDGLAGDAPAAVPAGVNVGSNIYALHGSLMVGYRQYLIGGPRTGEQIVANGDAWDRTTDPASYAALSYGSPLGTDGTQIVGSNGISAFLWTAPGPTGPWTSYVLGAGSADACANGRQFGQSNAHAAMWDVAHAQSDLHPSAATTSQISGAWGLDQSGDFTTTARHASLWHGLPIGVTDLSPAGSDSSAATALFGAYQVGHADYGGSSHAMIWGGNPALWTDLGAAAGGAYSATWANAMEVDDIGNFAVVGGGTRAADGVTVGLVWNSTPYAVILRDPVATDVVIGRDTTFTVVARGNGGVSYQWRHDGVAIVDDGRISGAQTATLAITHAAVADAGLYDVQVSNALRTTFSTPESLTVLTPLGVDVAVPRVTQFLGAAPTPVLSRTLLRFELAHPARATLRLYDVGGRMIATLLDAITPAGAHTVAWNTRDFAASAPGVYFARFQADGVSATTRLVVVR